MAHPRGIPAPPQGSTSSCVRTSLNRSVRDAPCAGRAWGFTEPPTCWSASGGSSIGTPRGEHHGHPQ
jgi:hypothetical protein